MTFLIAAAGTGGHVYPGLAVGEALLDRGVPRGDILYVGGDRLESEVYPDSGFPYLRVEMRGLQRSLTPRNLSLPTVVIRARKAIDQAIHERQVRAVLGMGGYVTIPAGLAARGLRIPFFNSEQNAVAGLANRVTSRWARTTFTSFPGTEGLPHASWVGNPVRRPFWDFDRERLRSQALRRYGLGTQIPVLGVVGGSLGSGVINVAVSDLAGDWSGDALAIVHLTGERFYEAISPLQPAPGVAWVRLPFEEEMEMFYAVSDLVLTRAGGAVAELTATSTPALLVPGEFGSGGHQRGNASFLAQAGAARIVEERDLESLVEMVAETVFDTVTLEAMRQAAARIARPRAAHTIADALIEAAG